MITINTIDGKLLAGMVISGANNLYNHKDEVDELNVFPVPDGDTGTNMSLTINAVSLELSKSSETSLTKVADKISFAALRGARGNSGVILSQLFRGFSKSLKGKTECNGIAFSTALSEGAAAAYKAVMAPTEGTILTVAREAASGAVEASVSTPDIVAIMKRCIERGDIALKNTPEQLPTLKEAGVVDAGGQGWFYVLEGMYEFLKTGEIVKSEASKSAAPAEVKTAQATISTEDIKFKYCTEFIIEKSDKRLTADDLRSTISKIGDCMLVIDDDDIVKVHIHTNNPGIVLEKAGEIGELINIKIDNMKHQHQSLIEDVPASEKKSSTKPEVAVKSPVIVKEYGFVAVCTGKGIVSILEDLDVDVIIEGGQTMNPSTDDFLDAIKTIPAKTIFLFPNNKNIILAANQAKELSSKNVIVIPSKSIPQCISALVAFSQNKSAELNEKAMNTAIKNVKTGQVTFAVRDTSIDGKPIKKGNILGIYENKITTVGKDTEAVLEALVEQMTDEDSEFITVYYGKGTKKQAIEKITDRLENLYPDCEVLVKKGGQPLYYYIISVE